MLDKLIIALIVSLMTMCVVVIGCVIYTEIAHPCQRYGDPYQTTITQCHRFGQTTTCVPVPYTARDCLEREP